MLTPSILTELCLNDMWKIEVLKAYTMATLTFV